MFSSFTILKTLHLLLLAMSGGQVDMRFVRWHWSHFLLPGPSFPWSCKLPGDRTPFGAGRWSGYVWAWLGGGDGGNIACHKGPDKRRFQ